MAGQRSGFGQLTLLALVLLLTCNYAIAVYEPFNCRRVSTRCVQGTCSQDGTCACPTGYQGPDCGLLTSSLRPNNCVTRDCLNGGSCYYNGTVHLCYCTAGFYGDRCQYERVSMSCAQGAMTAFINPFSNAQFTGRVYVYNFPSDINCRFKDAAQNGYQGYEIQLPLSGNGGCSSGRKRVIVNGDEGYQYEIFVRYDTRITSILDEHHTLTCVFTENGTLTATISTGFTETVFQSLTGRNARRGYQPVTLVVKSDGTDALIAAPVLVGDDLYLEFELPANDFIYTNYRVDTCVAYNSDENANQIIQDMALVTSSCRDEMAESVVKRITKEGSKTRLYFDAFKFDDTALVRFVCKITLCDQNTTSECDFDYSCSATARKRRQAVTQVLKTDVIGQSIQVWDSSTRLITAPEDQCNTIFYIVLAVLAAFALLTLICAIYLCFKMARRKRQYDTIVIRKRVLPDGNVVRSVEEVLPADSSSSDRGPIIRS